MTSVLLSSVRNPRQRKWTPNSVCQDEARHGLRELVKVQVLGNDGLTMTGLPHLAEKYQGEGSSRRVAAIDTGGETLCYEDIIARDIDRVSRNREPRSCCESFS